MKRLHLPVVFRVLMLLTLGVSGAAALAESVPPPKIFSTSLRYGLTPTLPAHTLASFNFTLENPANVEATVTIALEAEDGGNVFGKTLRIGPKAVIEDRCIIMVSPTENYKSTLTWKGNQITSDKCVIRLESGNRNPLFFINDDLDFAGTTALTKNPAIIRPLYLTTVRASNVPQNWAFFGDAVALVMVKPAFAEMNPLQVQALLDFVRHGGTMIWITPEGMMEAANTPFKDMLPVVPFRVRRTEDFKFLEAWRPASAPAMAPAAWLVPEGIPFLESIATGDGVTTITQGDFPVCRFRRYGLGTVGMIAFDPCSEYSQKSAFYVPLWNHMLTWGSRHPVASGKGGYVQQSRLLGQLSGFPIPQLSVIQLLLGSYLGGVAFILLLGFLLRRHVTAWMIVAVAGIILTIGIFQGAYRLAVNRRSQVATSIDLRAWSDGRIQGEKTISLFSKDDDRPTLQAGERLSLFYPLSTSTQLGIYARRDAFAQPLRVTRDTDRSVIDKLQIQALKPRKLCQAYAENAPDMPILPELQWGADDVKLKDWQIPEGFPPPEYGFMVLPGGVRPLVIKGRDCRDGGTSTGGLRLDTVATEAQGYLQSLRLPTPCLAFVNTSTDQQPRKFAVTGAKSAFFENEYTITVVPLTQTMEKARIRVPAEFVALMPAEAHTRLVLRDGNWVDSTLRGNETYPVAAQIPLTVAATLTADEVLVDADISNPGGNVECTVMLQDRSKPLPKPGVEGTQPPPGIAPTSRRGTSYVFTGLAKQRLLDPQTGRFGVLLYLQQKKPLTDMMDAERVNKWKVTSLRVSITGTLAETALPTRYGP